MTTTLASLAIAAARCAGGPTASAGTMLDHLGASTGHTSVQTRLGATTSQRLTWPSSNIHCIADKVMAVLPAPTGARIMARSRSYRNVAACCWYGLS